MNRDAAIRTFDSITTGEEVTLSRHITEEDVNSFASVSGDFSPLHVDESYAAATPFKRRVVHGMFLGALVSQLVGMRLPGINALLIKETLEFKKAVFIDDTVSVSAIVANKSAATRIIELNISITREDEEVTAGQVFVKAR